MRIRATTCNMLSASVISAEEKETIREINTRINNLYKSWDMHYLSKRSKE
jgi:hypothetical protein